MPKKKSNRKKSKKDHIKHTDFQDLNITPIEGHSHKKGKLESPFSVLGENTSLISWRDHGLNEVLWAALIRIAFSQERALEMFRKIVAFAREDDPKFKETFISHSALSTLSDEQFDELMHPLFEDDDIKDVLSTLLYIECLPDFSHWERNLKQPSPDSHVEHLMKAVSTCMEHQSQEATDIRWLKVMYCIIVQQRMHFPETFAEKLEGFRLYPNYGDQRSVRPSIRSMEIMLRGPHEDREVPFEIPETLIDKVPKPWSDEFWQECLEKTPCLPGDFEKPDAEHNQHYFDQFYTVYQNLAEHFIENTNSTSLDARRDSAYGLTLYSIFIGLAITRNGLHNRAEGRILLRTIVEGFITLKYLAHKDNPTIWQQFRQYGTGQTKLAFLKNLREESVPDFINLQDLHAYANEDIWQEYSDIGIKPWSEKNLRNMASEAGIKDFYDKYYDWSSAYVHGNWGAIRDTVFTVCLNPLHRFHRIPFIPKLDMPSVLGDVAKIINMMLNLNNQLFPPFKMRVKHPKK